MKANKYIDPLQVVTSQEEAFIKAKIQLHCCFSVVLVPSRSSWPHPFGNQSQASIMLHTLAFCTRVNSTPFPKRTCSLSTATKRTWLWQQCRARAWDRKMPRKVSSPSGKRSFSYPQARKGKVCHVFTPPTTCGIVCCKKQSFPFFHADTPSTTVPWDSPQVWKVHSRLSSMEVRFWIFLIGDHWCNPFL